MDSTVLIPLLYPMQQEFEDFGEGNCIQVTRNDVVHLGTLLVTHLRPQDLFGLTIQFGPSLVDANFPASTNGSFVTTGHAGLPIHHLSLEEIHRIQPTGDRRLPYLLEIMGNPSGPTHA